MSTGATVQSVPTSLGTVVVERSGRGSPLLCLHGIGSSARSFGHLLDVPPPGWEVLAWDAPGYHRSADPDRPPSLDDYARAAVEVLAETVHGRPAVVVGVSWGGVIATRIALRHRSDVRALVLAGSTVGSGADPAKAEAMGRRGDELASVGVAGFAAERGPRLITHGAPDELRRTVVEEMARSIRLPAYGWAAQTMAGADHRSELPSLALPVLVVAGQEDRITGPPAAAELHAGLSNAELHVIPHAGHLVNQERPDAFADLLRPFLDSLTPLTGGRP